MSAGDALSTSMVKLSVGCEGDHDPLNLPDFLAKIALEDFGETPETRAAALVELRKRIAELPDEKDRLEDVTDGNLIRFIRGRKYDMDRALETTVEMRRFKNENPDWFNPSPEALTQFDAFCGLLPTTSPTGQKVFVMFPAKGIKVGVECMGVRNVALSPLSHTPPPPPPLTRCSPTSLSRPTRSP